MPAWTEGEVSRVAARPAGPKTLIVEPLMDGQVVLEELIKKLQVRDVEGAIRCAQAAWGLNRMALGRIEGLAERTSRTA